MKSLQDSKPAAEEIVEEAEKKEIVTEPESTAATEASAEQPAPVESEQKDQQPAEITKPGSAFKFTPVTFDSPKKEATENITMKTPGKTSAEMSDLDKKLERAKRFKVDLDEKTKQQLRAQRFGESTTKQPQQQKQQKQQQGKKVAAVTRKPV